MAQLVLIPGAWLGAWAWREVTPRLAGLGDTCYPVTLTGMGERAHLASREVGMETAVQDVLNLIKYNELEEVVLVGHSFAGKVAAAVADRIHPMVQKVVYLDSFRPERVRTPQGAFDPSSEFGPPKQGQFSIPLSSDIVARIGPDVHGAALRRMLALGTPWPLKLASDPITLSGHYDSVQEAYIFCARSGDPVDEIVAGKWGRLVGPHRILDAGHWPMITQPEALAEALHALAQ